ncbi:MAG: hypothetical protein P3B98_02285 [Gemmatimonadota bacterium]|nr:hypothetical protein [Gemmatimonadota bacterium]
MACAVYGAHLCYAIISDRALFSDGAQFFIRLITSTAPWPVFDDSVHIRLLVNVLNQWPVSLARMVGVEDIPTLRRLFGASLFLQPALLYVYCYALSRRANDYRVFALTVTSVVSCVMPSELFVINQGITALALAWIALHYILLPMRYRWHDIVVMATVSVLLFRAHEGMVLWGGITAAAGILRLVAEYRALTGRPRGAVMALSLLGAAQSAFVLGWQKTHPVQAQTREFLELRHVANPWAMWTSSARVALVTGGVVAVIFVIAAAARARRAIGWARSDRAITIVVLGAIAIMGLSVGLALSDPASLDPNRAFQHRVLIPFGGALCMALAVAVMRMNVRLTASHQRLLAGTLAAGLIASSVWQMRTTAQWRVYRTATQDALRSADGPLVSSRAVMHTLLRTAAPEVWQFRNTWAWSVFGLSLQDSAVVTAVIEPDWARARFGLPRTATDSLRVPFVTLPASGILRFEQWTARLLAETAPVPRASPAP